MKYWDNGDHVGEGVHRVLLSARLEAHPLKVKPVTSVVPS